MIDGLKEIKNLDEIPVENMRRALMESGHTWSSGSQALGWGRDGKRLKKALGLAPKHRRMVKTIPYADAVKMVRAWRLDPVDYGV